MEQPGDHDGSTLRDGYDRLRVNALIGSMEALALGAEAISDAEERYEVRIASSSYHRIGLCEGGWPSAWPAASMILKTDLLPSVVGQPG